MLPRKEVSIMSSSPALILNNIPGHLRRNGQTISDAVLGSKTGKEVGVAFWKIHQSQPKFMIVFKHKEDRDKWVKTSSMLKGFMAKHNVRLTMIYYSRDRDLVIGEDEGTHQDIDWRSRPPSKAKALPVQSSDLVNTSRASDASGVACLGATFEDLDKLDLSQFSLPGIKDVKLNEAKDKARFKSVDIDRKSDTKSIEMPSPKKMSPTVPPIAMKDKKGDGRKLELATAAKMKENLSLPDFLQPMSELAVTKPSSSDKSVHSVSWPKITNPVESKRTKEETKSKQTTSEIKVRETSIGESMTNSTRVIAAPDTTVPPPGRSVDVSLPPPPLRLPLHVFPPRDMIDLKSNILEKLAIAAEKHFEGEGKDKTALTEALKDSWKDNIEKLENLYEKVLSDQGVLSVDLGLELCSIYKFEGTGKLSRSKALDVTKEFLTQSGNMVGADFNERFRRFLADNPHYKVSDEEVAHIMTRNGVDMFDLFKAYSREQSAHLLREKLQEKVKLGGQLFKEFSQLLIDFFNLNLSKIRVTRKQTNSSIAPPPGTSPKKINQDKVQADLNKLQDLLSKKDFKKAQSILKEVQSKVSKLSKESDEEIQEILTLKTENLQMMKEMNSVKEEAKERMKLAQQENKILRSRNSGLNDEALDAKLKSSQAQTKLDFVCKTLDSLAAGEDVQFRLDENNNEDDDVIQQDLEGFMKSVTTLKSMYQTQGRGNCGQGQSKVNFLTLDGKRMYVHTNRNNNIFVPEIERLIGKEVSGLRVPHILGTGHTELPARNGYIDSPQLGWASRDYEVTR